MDIAHLCWGMGWKLPNPRKVIDSALTHLENEEIFGEGKEVPCADGNVFTCIDQGLYETDCSYRYEECKERTLHRLSHIIEAYVNNKDKQDFGTITVAIGLSYSSSRLLNELGLRRPRQSSRPEKSLLKERQRI